MTRTKGLIDGSLWRSFLVLHACLSVYTFVILHTQFSSETVDTSIFTSKPHNNIDSQIEESKCPGTEEGSIEGDFTSSINCT